jgi:ribosome modulation factor
MTPNVTDAPFELGMLAWFDGRGEVDCPFPIPGQRAAKWLAGWREAEAEFNRHPATEHEYDLGEVVG